MTSSVESKSIKVIDDFNAVYTYIAPVHSNNRERKHILKAKENTYKHKCEKSLKRKLKKYKLRRDGSEDQDVLDVSNILVSSLVINSQSFDNSLRKGGDLGYLEELRPKNYLFKMVRRKNTIKISNGIKSPNKVIKQNDVVEIPEPVSQEKKHTNAFKLLMDSRNKSIGSNSPGKEVNPEQSESELLEKKNLKAKRNLLLQKMANAKGYLKNKEMEECQDKIIKIKMDKRAERLKSMILKDSKPANDSTKTKVIDSPIIDEPKVPNNYDKKQPKAFKIIDIFNTLDEPIIVNPLKQHIPKEDREFLNKLSPSLKKKESMLSYFKKVDKEPEDPVELDSDNIIKVKLQINLKKRGRKKKLSLKRNTIDFSNELDVNDENNDVACDSKTIEIMPVGSENTDVVAKGECLKRKRISKSDDVLDVAQLDNESRPKRSIKRPVKYLDEAYLSSSDEELHIFTPKKKKHVESKESDKVTNVKSKPTIFGTVKSNEETKVAKKTNTPKKPVKLAPIFAAKQLDPAALEAKQKFLQSGVPDKLKKIIQQQKNHNTLSSDFPVIVHVQQTELVVPNISVSFLKETDDDFVEDVCPVTYEDGAFKKLLNLNQALNICSNIDSNRQSVQAMLQSLKQLHPKFPVYRTYRYLRSKGKGEIKDCSVEFDNSIEVINDVVDIINDSPDRLSWTDKYKAMSTNQIIGNFESIKELKKWLISWNEIKSKSRANVGSDSSDYYQSDTDSRDSFKSTNNLLVLTGPTGCGKTSSVYAVAAELAMKVIEVNASSKRTGKIMLQDLQEATQSHKVNRGTGTDSSQKSQEKGLTEMIRKNKKRGRPKKLADKTKKNPEKLDTLSSTPSSQESARTDMSLILIDDADIVFDQDDGFSSAILQLVQCSKRPVILITSSLLCPHLQRFIQNGKILKMCPLSPRLLGTWLDIMCLADSGISWPGVGAKFLDYFKGDIRKTINYLQFYISSYAQITLEDHIASQNSDNYKANIDDENSSMSWADNEELESRKLTSVYNSNIDKGSYSMWTDFVRKQSNVTNIGYPLRLFDVWWTVPELLSTTSYVSNKINKTNKTENKVLELETIANTIDAISLSDCISPNNKDSSSHILAKPWYTPEYDSVSEQDNLDNYACKYEVGDEICHTLISGCINAAQDALNCDRRGDISFARMSLQRERDKVVSRHKSLSSYLSSWATFDRRSLALDYWSSCRTICRIEKSKNDANISTKRNNRFSHYLKSLNVLCKSDMFDNLCDSLSNQGTEFSLPNTCK